MCSKKLLIVGTGITGAISASLIKNATIDVQITMWESATKTGGRMSTTKSLFYPASTVDLGAQYITRHPEFTQSHARFFEELLEEAVLKPLDTIIEGMVTSPPGTSNYVTPKGIGSIVEHFIQKSKATVLLDQRLDALKMSECGSLWLASTSVATHSFDAVLLTMPIPQVLQVQGHIQELLVKDEKLKERMQTVAYTSRYTLALFYNKQLDYFDSLPWSAKYFVGSHIVFVAIDNKKRGGSHFPTVVVHTSCSFAAENSETNEDLVQEKIMAILYQILPGLPSTDNVVCHKWKYSQLASLLLDVYCYSFWGTCQFHGFFRRISTAENSGFHPGPQTIVGGKIDNRVQYSRCLGE